MFRFMKKGSDSETMVGNQKNHTTIPETYFQTAISWYDQNYTGVIISRNRYQFAFFVAMVLCSLLAVALVGLTPLKKTELVILHQQDDGYAWVETTKPMDLKFTHSAAQMESEITHYIEMRESYSAETYVQQAKLVKYFSTSSVENTFLKEQEEDNSAISLLGKETLRTIHVESIQFLGSDQEPESMRAAKNVALVNFTALDKSLDGQIKNTQHYQVMLAFTWIGEPSDPDIKRLNYDGFEITSYQRTLVTVSEAHDTHTSQYTNTLSASSPSRPVINNNLSLS